LEFPEIQLLSDFQRQFPLLRADVFIDALFPTEEISALDTSVRDENDFLLVHDDRIVECSFRFFVDVACEIKEMEFGWESVAGFYIWELGKL